MCPTASKNHVSNCTQVLQIVLNRTSGMCCITFQAQTFSKKDAMDTQLSLLGCTGPGKPKKKNSSHVLPLVVDSLLNAWGKHDHEPLLKGPPQRREPKRPREPKDQGTSRPNTEKKFYMYPHEDIKFLFQVVEQIRGHLCSGQDPPGPFCGGA